MKYTTVDLLIKTLDNEGMAFLPYDQDISHPDYPEGSIEWLEFYVSKEIFETTGFGSKMNASLTEDGICITSVRLSKAISFDASRPEEFVCAVKDTMENFYLAL